MSSEARVVELGPGERDPDLIDALVDGTLDLVRIRAVLSPAECATAAVRLEERPLNARDKPGDPREQVGAVGWIVAPSDLYPTGPDPQTYFAAAEPFLEALDELFPVPPLPLLHDALTRASGVPVARPEGPQGAYGMATLRRVPGGSGMGFHCESLYAHSRLYERLGELADIPHQFSWICVVRAPEAGGELELTDLVFDEVGPMSPEDAERRGEVILRLPPTVGDLVVFRAGQLYHRICPVTDGIRVTLGGFGARAWDRDRIYAWS